MIGILKWLFGIKNDPAENMMQGMAARASKWEVIGADLAKDCYQNGLAKGEIIRLSEMTSLISENYTYNTNIVQSGFLSQMDLYLHQGSIVNVNDEHGDIVFVHKDFAGEILK